MNVHAFPKSKRDGKKGIASPSGTDELQRLRERVAMLEAVINNFPSGILLTDKDMTVVLCNDKQRALLEYPDSLFSHGNPSLRELFHFNAARGEYGPGEVNEIVSAKMELVRKGEAHIFERQRPNGRYLEIRGVPLPGGGFVTSYTDVTENRRRQASIAEMALTDPLTGLSNRLHFQDRMQHALALAKRGGHFAIHSIDLDGFKPINDTLGHDAGDSVLKQVAERLRLATRETDTVARIGGDEFIVIQADIDGVAAARKLAQRLCEDAHQPYVYGDGNIHVGVSIGVALSIDAPLDASELLKRADQALYACKRGGKGRFSVY